MYAGLLVRSDPYCNWDYTNWSVHMGQRYRADGEGMQHVVLVYPWHGAWCPCCCQRAGT